MRSVWTSDCFLLGEKSYITNQYVFKSALIHIRRVAFSTLFLFWVTLRFSSLEALSCTILFHERLSCCFWSSMVVYFRLCGTCLIEIDARILSSLVWTTSIFFKSKIPRTISFTSLECLQLFLANFPLHKIVPRNLISSIIIFSLTYRYVSNRSLFYNRSHVGICGCYDDNLQVLEEIMSSCDKVLIVEKTLWLIWMNVLEYSIVQNWRIWRHS